MPAVGHRSHLIFPNFFWQSITHLYIIYLLFILVVFSIEVQSFQLRLRSAQIDSVLNSLRFFVSLFLAGDRKDAPTGPDARGMVRTNFGFFFYIH